MNEIMLEETRDTITVPATLMIRMLGTIHILRKHFFCEKKRISFSILRFETFSMPKFEFFSIQRRKQLLEKLVKMLWLD